MSVASKQNTMKFKQTIYATTKYMYKERVEVFTISKIEFESKRNITL